MPIDRSLNDRRLVIHAAGIVASYVSNNAVEPNDLVRVIADTHRALIAISAPPPAPEDAKPDSALSKKKTIYPEYLICLEDGLKFKTLKRHLASLGMTPQEYRAKWNLPYDYPMVAAKYAARRSELAKKTGLGAKGSAAKSAVNKKTP
ncbi:MAG: MucR family transcriptional regulator [Candidatus Devosia phytovorans]|uniref:MucR family transcriptional regulator n=1 Tax=Candidatus Devosia phytovorans TaxID=3121372 RepID=A0AAJ5W087_9HYPH|nr:MucR family transcriptional regulator [Devosia sp.]WEK06739.1 MAG: MucR family transcriptional regulator [Devosia sp.]